MLKTRKLNIIDGLELKEATFRNREFPSHFHDTFSIGLITEGIERITIEGKHFITPANTIVIVNQNEIHANSGYDSDAWAYKTLNLSIDALRFFCKANNHSPRLPFHFENVIHDNILYQMLSNFHNETTSDTVVELSQIARYLIVNYLQKKPEKQINYAEWHALVDEAKHELAGELHKRKNLKALAKKLHLTPFQLTRAFKAHTGLTPIAYLNLLRLSKAKQLLTQQEPLASIALDCGFYDQSHFTKSFSKQFGITPMQYFNNYTQVPS